jgi:hypothetical protein
MRAAVRMAKKMGEGLGRGALLLGSLPGRGARAPKNWSENLTTPVAHRALFP